MSSSLCEEPRECCPDLVLSFVSEVGKLQNKGNAKRCS